MEAKRFQILALPGGGFLGLHTAVILAEIEKYLGHSITEHFDLIAGASIGGIIATGLLSGVDAEQIAETIETKGPGIFTPRPIKDRWYFKLGKLGAFAKLNAQYGQQAAFDPQMLRSAISEIVGDKILGEASRYAIIPVLNLTRGGPSVLKTPHHENFFTDYKMSMVDVGVSGAAAPLLFPLSKVDDRLYADGAFFANSPELIAIHEARTFLGQKIENIKILTVGTTTGKLTQGHSSGTDWGAMDWFKDYRILEFLMASQVGLVREMVKHMLGEKFSYIDSDRSPYSANDIGLTNTSESAIATLRSLGKQAAKEALGKDNVREFFKHAAERPVFHYGPNASVKGK